MSWYLLLLWENHEPFPYASIFAPFQVHQDSSFLTYSLTTAYQRVLMDTMSGGSR